MKDKFRTVTALLVLICALILINLGIEEGQVQEVLEKAANICMECIGIG